MYVSRHTGIALTLFSVFCLTAIFFFVPTIHQSPSYHQFADTREVWGIPNFMNVISNVFFCVVSMTGFIFLSRKWNEKKLTREEVVVFLTIFIGIFLTGIGSAYYHWNPGNENLVWDRIPMTIVFMSLLSLTIMEKVNSRRGFLLFVPLLIFGIASVAYWHWTDDLRLYGFVQFYSIFLILAILYFFQNAYPPLRIYIWMFVFYGIAKGFELFDAPIYEMTGFISGHTLKHIAAAISASWIVVMLDNKVSL